MADLLSGVTAQGPFGGFSSRSEGVSHWPGIANVEDSDRAVIEDVQKGRRGLALIPTRLGYTLFQHAPSGTASPYTDGARWGYVVYQTQPLSFSSRDTVSATTRAFLVAVCTFAAGVLGGSIVFSSMVSSRLDTVVANTDSRATIELLTSVLNKYEGTLKSPLETIATNTSSEAIQRAAKAGYTEAVPKGGAGPDQLSTQLSTIERNTSLESIKSALKGYFADVAQKSDGYIDEIAKRIVTRSAPSKEGSADKKHPSE
ncbi:hypothetical protein ACVMII_003890 [Bradyrhizobium diazoefficiens]